MRARPRVCIGVPVYNGGRRFAEMLESLRGQTYTDFEIFITDNCSTDETPEVARRLASLDSRIRYFRNESNLGASGNFNRVLELAGECTYFKWAAHDDLYAPAFLERCIDVLNREPEVVLAYPVADVVDETGSGLLEQHPFYHYGRLAEGLDAEGRVFWTMGPLHLAESPDPGVRYSEFLNRNVALFQLFGVIRASALPGITLRPYFGADRALLAELVLKGPLRQVDERLYTNRYHRSAARLLPKRDHAFWSGGRRKRLSSRRLQQIDLLCAPFRVEMSPWDRFRCFQVAVHHIARREGGALVRSLLRSPALRVGKREPGIC